MKKSLLSLTLLAASTGIIACAGEEKKSAAVGSIRPQGKTEKADLPALTKISYDYAAKIANGAVPGKIIEAELEVEDGNLQYAFDIVGADGALTEVEVDAGNAKILDTDKESAADSAKAAALAAKATVAFDTALKSALGSAPGTLLKGKLEDEDGRSQFEFKILGADKKITEVEVDATTGKVLKVKKHDSKSEEHEDKDGDKED